jgi:hypothetical protein
MPPQTERPHSPALELEGSRPDSVGGRAPRTPTAGRSPTLGWGAGHPPPGPSLSLQTAQECACLSHGHAELLTRVSMASLAVRAH